MSISGGVHLVSSNHLHGTPVKKTNLPPLFSRDILLKCKKTPLYFQPLLARLPISLTCKAAGNSNNDTRNPDFSKKNYQRRESEGPPPPRGKFKNYQDRDHDLLETTQLLSSKNGRSSTTNPLTAPTKSVNKDEILELFRRHLPQLRENRPVNSNNRSYGPQATLQKRGEEEREAFDSLLKLLKSYGPDHGRRPSNNSNDTKATINGRSEKYEGENINGGSNFEDDEVPEAFDSEPVPVPVPVVKHEPIVPSKTQMLREEEKSGTVSVFYEAESEGPQSEEEEKMLNLGALKLSELREIAKSRGLKGYTKLKKAELLEQLSAN